MKLSTCAVFLLPLLLLLGCGDYQRQTPRGGTEFFPLLQDRVLRYRLNEFGDVREYTMKFRYLGGKSYKIFKAEFKGLDLGGLEFSSHKSQVAAISQFSFTSLKPRREKADFYQLWIDENLAPGALWEDEDTGTQTVFTGYETVTVPAGTYEDCYKTVTEALPELTDSVNARYDRGEMTEDQYQQELANSELVIVRWFAAEVGLVKERIGSSNYVRELMAVENEGWFTPESDNSNNNE